MNNKEKLELLWKYLSLFVITILGFTYLETVHFDRGSVKDEFVFIGNEDFDDFQNNGFKKMEVDVIKEIVNGDTVMHVTLNGKPINATKFVENNNEIKWTSDDGENHVIKIPYNDDYRSGNKKIIRKKIKEMNKKQ